MNWILEQLDFIQYGVELAVDQELLDAVNGFAKAIDDNADNIKKLTEEAEKDNANFLGVSYFDKDFWKLLFKFFVNFSVIMVIVRALYYPIAKRKDYLFTYIMISMMIFMICFTLKKFEMGMGMALGLFAIFGIIRYRTDAIPIKEMTYLFIVIGVSVINALANKKMSYAELAFTNMAIIGATFALEKLWLLKHEKQKTVIYENVDLLRPEKYGELKADLENRIGLKINRIEIGKINFLNDTVVLRIFFFEEEQEQHNFESLD